MWSLGVVLVNLTCGRNPWKRASLDDSTYRAFKKDPTFLQSILPISPELNAILARIFEADPARRITIPELEQLVFYCPRFTMTSVCSTSVALPVTPPASQPQPFYQRHTPVASSHPVVGHPSQSSSNSNLSDVGSTFSGVSDCSSASSNGSWIEVPPQALEQKPQMVVFGPPQPQHLHPQPFFPQQRPLLASQPFFGNCRPTVAPFYGPQPFIPHVAPVY